MLLHRSPAEGGLQENAKIEVKCRMRIPTHRQLIYDGFEYHRRCDAINVMVMANDGLQDRLETLSNM